VLFSSIFKLLSLFNIVVEGRCKNLLAFSVELVNASVEWYSYKLSRARSLSRFLTNFSWWLNLTPPSVPSSLWSWSESCVYIKMCFVEFRLGKRSDDWSLLPTPSKILIASWFVSFWEVFRGKLNSLLCGFVVLLGSGSSLLYRASKSLSSTSLTYAC